MAVEIDEGKVNLTHWVSQICTFYINKSDLEHIKALRCSVVTII